MVKSKQLKDMRKKIDKADKLANPLSVMQAMPADLPFNMPTAPATNDDNKAFDLQALSSAELTQENLQTLLDMFESNMGEMYRISTWGLNLEEKAEELRHRKARFLLVWSKGEEASTPPKIAADDERPDWAVLYIYEIQVEADFQRKGLGRSLMLVLEEVGRQTQMTKIMLTVFHRNAEGMKFYMDRMGYAIDEASPSQCGDRVDYEILSKPL
eukprot:scaffold1453_cov195-Amphora_coffeaeformis.AAC.12